MCESPAAFGRDFCKRRWESAFFADSHGRGIFHQAVCHVVLPTNFTEDPNFHVFVSRRLCPDQSFWLQRTATQPPQGLPGDWDGCWVVSVGFWVMDVVGWGPWRDFVN